MKLLAIFVGCILLASCATAPQPLKVDDPVKYTVAGVDYWAVRIQSKGPMGMSMEIVDVHDKDGKLIVTLSVSNPGGAQNIPGAIAQVLASGMTNLPGIMAVWAR